MMQYHRAPEPHPHDRQQIAPKRDCCPDPQSACANCGGGEPDAVRDFLAWVRAARRQGYGPEMVNICDGEIVGFDAPFTNNGTYCYLEPLPSEGGTLFKENTNARRSGGGEPPATDPESAGDEEPASFIIDVDLFNLQVGVFRTFRQRSAAMAEVGIVVPDLPEHHAFASAHMDHSDDDDGLAWFSMVITRRANMSTWAHECVHVADFIMDHLGIPTGAENTEIRGYLVGHLFHGLQDGLGGGA